MYNFLIIFFFISIILQFCTKICICDVLYVPIRVCLVVFLLCVLLRNNKTCVLQKLNYPRTTIFQHSLLSSECYKNRSQCWENVVNAENRSGCWENVVNAENRSGLWENVVNAENRSGCWENVVNAENRSGCWENVVNAENRSGCHIEYVSYCNLFILYGIVSVGCLPRLSLFINNISTMFL